ncbi:MAG: hypothetical protein CFE44_07795 [Burkholderiales bacterium PBB4]|nr:MAG: hypothetical protein CFE44_07795 [Burkholderiales bacterium PBB4]
MSGTVTEASAFQFRPASPCMTGAAFSRPFKLLAIAIFGLALLWAVRLWQGGAFAPTLQSWGWVTAAVAMMGYTVWHVLQASTTLDAHQIEQTWVWHKRVELSNLAYAKLIRLHGLEWLIAPRLYTRSFSGKLAVFYAADHALLAELERLASELQTLRKSA